MNYRQCKKKIYKKSVEHGYWKKYKKAEREFFGKIRLHKEFPNRRRVRQLLKLYQ